MSSRIVDTRLIPSTADGHTRLVVLDGRGLGVADVVRLADGSRATGARPRRDEARRGVLGRRPPDRRDRPRLRPFHRRRRQPERGRAHRGGRRPRPAAAAQPRRRDRRPTARPRRSGPCSPSAPTSSSRAAPGCGPPSSPPCARRWTTGAHPVVNEFGAVGTGDIAALAQTGLALVGEHPWDRRTPPRRRAPSPALDNNDALALISSNALTLGQAALALARTARAARRHARRRRALAARRRRLATRRTPRPCTPPARTRARSHVAARMRATSLGAPDRPTPPLGRIQDPYGFRCLPQIHGPAQDAADALERVLAVEINAAAENPLISPEDRAAYHHGGFYQRPTRPGPRPLPARRSLQTARLSTARLVRAQRARLHPAAPLPRRPRARQLRRDDPGVRGRARPSATCAPSPRPPRSATPYSPAASRNRPASPRSAARQTLRACDALPARARLRTGRGRTGAAPARPAARTRSCRSAARFALAEAVLDRGHGRPAADGRRDGRAAADCSTEFDGRIVRARRRGMYGHGAARAHDGHGRWSGGRGRTDVAAASPAARLQALFEGHRLTPTQRRIAHCMVRRAADVPFLSSVELAELAGVSQPSVTRFAVALGFDGYPALRRHLREVAPAEPATAGDGRVQRVPAGRRRPRSRTCATSPTLLADPAPVAAGGPAARRLPAAAGPRPARRRRPGVRLRVLRRQGPPGRTAARRGRHDARRPHRRGRARRAPRALLCFALPRHPREVVDALALRARRPG